MQLFVFLLNIILFSCVLIHINMKMPVNYSANPMASKKFLELLPVSRIKHIQNKYKLKNVNKMIIQYTDYMIG